MSDKNLVSKNVENHFKINSGQPKIVFLCETSLNLYTQESCYESGGLSQQ